MSGALGRNVWLSAGALLTSLTTLVCCVLPAVLVALGAGAVVVGLVSAVPQLIWLSEHKGLVFGVAGAMLAVSGLALVQGRRLPCPADPALAAACQRLRRWSARMYGVAVGLFLVGVGVTFGVSMVGA